jgi:hypothetical protein
MTFSWQAVSALSSIVAATTVIVTASIALRQFREAAASRQFQSIVASVQQLQSSSLRNVRWLLRHNQAEISQMLEGPDPLVQLNSLLSRPDHPPGSPKSVGDLRTSLAVLEFLSVLSLSNKIPTQLEQSYLAPTMVSYWLSMESIILAMRTDSGDALYLHNFEAFVRLALAGTLYESRGRVAGAKKRELGRRVELSREAILFRAHKRNSQLFGRSLAGLAPGQHPSSVEQTSTEGSSVEPPK